MRSWDVIGDVGCGQGQLAVPLARYAYDGKVYAIDTLQKNLDVVKEKARLSKISNIDTVHCKDSAIPLEDNSLDGAVLASLTADSSKPKLQIKEVYRLLKKGGWLAVILWRKPTGKEEGALVKKPSEEFSALALEAGFKSVSARPLNGSRFLLVLRK